MADAGVGVNMLEVSRMRRVLQRRPGFVRRVFSEEERLLCEGSTRPAENYAARFAARAAVLRALGIAGDPAVRVQDVCVGGEEDPVVRLSGRAAQAACDAGVEEVALSLSFTRDVAVANAVAVTAASRPPRDVRDDAAKALAASFREARAVIDELERVGDGPAPPVAPVSPPAGAGQLTMDMAADAAMSHEE